MKLEEMGLQIGDLLQLQQMSDPTARHPVKVIGYVPGKSLLTTAPYIGPGRLAPVKENQKVIIRFAIHNAVTGFKTNVMYTRNIPFPYLHLQIPDNIETMEVRKAHRVATAITVTVINESSKNKKTQTAQIVDLSPVGARMIAPRVLAEADQKLSITLEIDVAGVQKTIVLEAMCRSVSSNDDKSAGQRDSISHGLQFIKTDDEDKLALHGYVYQKMLQQMNVL